MQDTEKMAEVSATLCAPDDEKSCFACCPPIRPLGYEHLQYTNEIKRVLRENTASLRTEERSVSPITGFSCWGLGYLNGGFKRIGCLLHPSQNNGEDLRYRVNFGDKCARESCVEARIFTRLSSEVKSFWLRISDGLDSFSYSSRTLNPLFRILGWGVRLLNLVAMAEQGRDLNGDSILKTYCFFETTLSPRANAYLVRALIDPETVALLKNARFRGTFEEWARRLSEQLSLKAPSSPTAPYVHLLSMDYDFLDFLRLSGHLLKADEEEAAFLKEFVDRELAAFRDGFL